MAMKLSPFVAALGAACLLAACGGGGGGGDDSSSGGGDNPPPVSADKFTSKDNKLVLPLAGAEAAEHCFDLNKPGNEAVACTSGAWDLKVSMPAAGGRGQPLFWTNSGDSGPGKGGALGGPFDSSWADLKKIEDATIDPESGQAVPDRAFLTDGVSGAFTGTNAIGTAAFEYNLTGDNKLHPNFRVFQITLDKAAPTADNTYALQVLGYYGGPGGATSGYVTVRLAGMGNLTQYQSQEINASAAWQYLDLSTGNTVPETGNWHVAFNRYNIKLNPANAGVGALAGDAPAGLYDANGDPVVSAFTAARPDSTSVLALFTGATLSPANAYKADSKGSPLQPASKSEGTYPNLTVDYGWYGYTATTHLLAAKDDRGVLIRSGEGDSYMRFRLESIVYDPVGDYNGKQTWTIEYDLQPASGS
ncbi:hypothetical protein H0484_06095 [Pusillimonas sp. CC-YST705]|uniref:Uncharacterized protein n=1 Tax=Mesopusillimonas faecipullorum TaxID=2755040 RepID=A0ABS8CCK0_9BURK|nr:HmuY family protein [Mesopusillimonas faecipullorum]MCB5363324.1 hypothetical protein [Mesopusillimonas faecipullorum]